jgi:hypothetical protein
MPEQHR